LRETTAGTLQRGGANDCEQENNKGMTRMDKAREEKVWEANSECTRFYLLCSGSPYSLSLITPDTMNLFSGLLSKSWVGLS
jgi:hypothetical protein